MFGQTFVTALERKTLVVGQRQLRMVLPNKEDLRG